MLFLTFTLIYLSQSLLAVDLSIYKSFTQVRQLHSGVGEYSYEFFNTEYENIIDGSINWEGTPFLRQEVYNTAESLKGAKVIVRQPSTCGCEKVQAKIIDPDTMLLQNSITGAYFYADKQSIEYASVQPDNGKKALLFKFESEKTQHDGTLSYLMKGITWKPNYDLTLIGTNDYKLRSYANIINNQQREYTVENTNLLGGDIQLATTSSESLHGPQFLSTHSSSLRPIQIDGEQKGLYSYSLKDKYTLHPMSSVRLPFININAKYRFYYKALINIATQQGIFERNYDITPDQFMPAGIITIRDNQVLVGQAILPDVPKNYTETISVGRDNDIRYSVKANLTSKTDEKAPIQMETYELDVEIMNFKDKNVDTQLVLEGGVSQMNLLGTTCKSIKVTGNQLNLSMQLEKGETRLCKINITVKLA